MRTRLPVWLIYALSLAAGLAFGKFIYPHIARYDILVLGVLLAVVAGLTIWNVKRSRRV